LNEELRQKIIKEVRELIKNPKFTIKDVSDPALDSRDVAIHVKGVIDENLYAVKKDIQYFVAIPYNEEFFWISTYFYFDKSDSSGFTLLPDSYKVLFANEMKVPLLTLGLTYKWIPSLEKIESLEMQKRIWYDGFSKHNFYDSLTRVLNGYEIVAARYEEFKKFIHDEKQK
jgi:hypothetical protein